MLRAFIFGASSFGVGALIGLLLLVLLLSLLLVVLPPEEDSGPIGEEVPDPCSGSSWFVAEAASIALDGRLIPTWKSFDTMICLSVGK